MISQTAEYALRAIAYLAEHFGEPCTSHAVAEATRVPQDYMSKVLRGLVDAGIISSQRGLYGGFRLSRSPDELVVYDIVEAVSPLQRIRECPMGKVHEGGLLCPLHRMLDEAMGQIEAAFRSVTIGALLETSRRGSAICDVTAAKEEGGRCEEKEAARNVAATGSAARRKSRRRSGRKGATRSTSARDAARLEDDRGQR